MSAVVTLRDVVSVSGAFPVLSGVDLDVNSGEIVLLSGPNGAGKTSLLRLCAGLLPIERGSATVLGCDLVADRASVRRRVGLLGHVNGLYMDLSVEQNISFWARLVGASTVEVAAAMTRMGLDGRLRSVRASQLSAGQRRRCAMAAMIVRRAELWLLDEPHAGLDAAARDEIDSIIVEAVAAGATVVLSSHERDRGESLATRSVTVTGGTTREVRP